MRALAQPLSGGDDPLTSITSGRPAPYGEAAYRAAGYGGRTAGGDGAASDIGEIWEYERDLAPGADGASGSGAANGAAGNGADGQRDQPGHGARRAQVIVLAAAAPANAYGTGWDIEEDLDIEYASGMAPKSFIW